MKIKIPLSDTQNFTVTLERAEDILQKLGSSIREAKEIASLKMRREHVVTDLDIENSSLDVLDIIRKLSRTNFPEDSICSHLGYHSNSTDKSLRYNLMFNSATNNLLALTLTKNNNKLPNGSKLGFAKEETRKRIESLEKILGCKSLDVWNHYENCEAFTIVFDMAPPNSLVVAINNYRELSSPFNLPPEINERFTKFKDWVAL